MPQHGSASNDTMKYVPSLPPPITAPADSFGVKALTRVKSVRPVQERTLPPLVTQRHNYSEAPPDTIQHDERRHAEPLPEERRVCCRRINHLPVMEELRSAIERRRHKQRGSDSTEHIDEEA